MGAVSGLSSPIGSETMNSLSPSYQRDGGALKVSFPVRFWWLMAVVALCFGSVPARALTEYELKAAFLFNFAKFIDWPPRAFPAPSAPLIFGIMGE
ncbi:MAG: YfiR family protein, partial [Limisphaerales bacterium]